MDRIKITRAKADCIDLLVQWREKALKDASSDASDDSIEQLLAATRAYYEAHLADDTHKACFLKLNEEIVGCGGVCLFEELPSLENPSGRCARFVNVYTLPDTSEHGFAEKIALWLTAQAQEYGAGTIYAENEEA